MNSKKLKFGGLVLAAFVAAMGLSACAGENGADGLPGKDGIDGIAGEDGADGAKGADGENGTSCSAKLNEDESGYVLSCGGKEVGTILNGKNGENGKNGLNGEDGEDGTSCTAKVNAKKTGYVLSCGGREVGEILNGESGEDGDGCSLTALEDGSGVMIACGDEDGVVIKNGKDGENAKTVYTMAMMNGGRVTREYVVNSNGELVVGSVAEKDKGVGNFVTWDGAKAAASGDYQIKTGEGKPEFNPGWWYSYGDNGDGGKSSVTWPVDIGNPFSDDAKDPVIDICGGLCGTYVLDKGDLDYEPFVGVGFNVAGNTKVGTENVLQAADVTDWKGICVAFAASGTDGAYAYAELSPQNEKTLTEYDNPKFRFSAKSSAVINMPWSAFKAEGWSGKDVSAEEVVKILASVKFAFRGGTDDAGYFNIQKVGMYGHCGEEAPNPYEGIPQYEFVAGTNVLKPAKIADADKGVGITTWNHEALPSNNAVHLANDDENRYWNSFTDEVDLNGGKGTTEFTFPAEFDAWGGMTKIIDHCDGICGTVTMGEWSGVAQEYDHYAVIYFDVKTSEDKGNVAKDIHDWKGVCLTYSATGDAHISVDLSPKNAEFTTKYDNPAKVLPKAAPPITVNLSWNDFVREGWGTDVSFNELLGEMQAIRVHFKGKTGESAEFNIMQFGAYGNCR